MIRMHFLSIRLAHRGTMVKMLESTAAPNAPGLMINDKSESKHFQKNEESTSLWIL